MISVPHIQQGDSSRCGPTGVKMILKHYDIDATEDELCVKCNHSYDKGCTAEGMVKALKSYGLSAKIYNNSSLEDIEYWIKHHVPVIVDWFASGSTPDEIPDGHTGIVVDIDKEMIYILDPRSAKVLTFDRQDFLQVWFDWKGTGPIKTWKDMILRQLIVAYPKRLG